MSDKKRLDRVIWGVLIMVIPYVAVFLSFNMYKGYGIISAFFLAIVFMFVGIILWAVSKYGFKKNLLGLGFATGGLATFLVMFIFTGGCGMFL